MLLQGMSRIGFSARMKVDFSPCEAQCPPRYDVPEEKEPFFFASVLQAGSALVYVTHSNTHRGLIMKAPGIQCTHE